MDGDITAKQDESFDYWLTKFDSASNLMWQKTYGGTSNDRGNSIIQTADNGYVILGNSQSNDGDISTNAGSSDFWVSKLTNSGDLVWEQSYGFAGSDDGNAIIQTNDGGYLLVGVLDVSASGGLGNSKINSGKSSSHAGGDYWAIKLNASGTKEWSRFYGGSFTDIPFDVMQTSDNGYLIVGSSDSNDVDITNNIGTYDFWVIKISETGTLVWEKSFGGSEIDESRAIVQTNDGNYVIIGDTRSDTIDVSSNKGAADFWLIKMTPNGDLIWERTIGGSSFDAGRSIAITQDGGFVIVGSSRSADGDVPDNNGQNDAFMIKVDTNANIVWQKTIGGSEIDLFEAVTELNNGTIVAVGESNSADNDIIENKGFTDALIYTIKDN
ncbi:hypothetical protein [Changchengzhania lutea]|uniref:hypothetical protein n=1 Tax=Changchengzhania lutea TaxID=2049305 RepID=UPI001FEABA9B|nr:hypothetical protein [Changchengzhania lutea]